MAAGSFQLSAGIAHLTSLRSFHIEAESYTIGDLWCHPTLTHLSLAGRWDSDARLSTQVSLPALKKVTLECYFSHMGPPPPEFFSLSTLTAVVLFDDGAQHGDWSEVVGNLHRVSCLLV